LPQIGKIDGVGRPFFCSFALLGALMTLGCAKLAVDSAIPQSSDNERLAGLRGLPVSAPAASFMPFHLTGPNAGGEACPLCIYGLQPQFQLWVDEAKLSTVEGLARRLDLEAKETPATEDKKNGFVAYLVVAAENGGKLSSESERLIKSWNLEEVFVTYVPSWDDLETAGLYGHSMSDRPGSRGYLVVNRRLYARWETPSETNWDEIKRRLEESRPHVSTYDLVDAQIAPTWEPGQRMTVRFRVVDKEGKPLGTTKVTANQTDREGLYNPAGWHRRIPRLSTIAWTNEEGYVNFDTVWPGPYPHEPEPSHIHFSVVINDQGQFRTLWFEGDPLITPEKRKWTEEDAETVIVPVDKSSSPWKVEHTFTVE